MARLFDDANNEFLEIDQTPVTSAPFTIAMWFFGDPASWDNDYCLAQIGDKDVADQYWRLGVRGDLAPNNLTWSVNDGNFYDAISVSPSLNTWSHACGIEYAADSRACFLNGANKGTSSNSATPAGSDRITIGREGDSSPGDEWSGGITEVAIWNVALTDIEAGILALGYSPLFVRSQNLVFYAPLIRDEDNDIVRGLHLSAFSDGAGPSITAHPRIIYPAPKHISFPVVAAPAETVATSIVLFHQAMMRRAS